MHNNPIISPLDDIIFNLYNLKNLNLRYQNSSGLNEKITKFLLNSRTIQELNLSNCNLKINVDLIQAAIQNNSLRQLNIEFNYIDEDTLAKMNTTFLSKIKMNKEYEEILRKKGSTLSIIL